MMRKVRHDVVSLGGSPMIWKMRAAAVVIVVVFFVIALRPPAPAIEAGLLALGLASAAYYVKLHRRLLAERKQAEKEQSAGPT
jgi:flagellar biosynthesis component FlhA